MDVGSRLGFALGHAEGRVGWCWSYEVKAR